MNPTELLGRYNIPYVDVRELWAELTYLRFCFSLQAAEQLRSALGKIIVR